MKKLLYLLLPALCLLLLTSIAFASGTIAKDDGIRGAPTQQDREGLYAAPFPIAAQPSIETAFLPQGSPVQVAFANETFTAQHKVVVAVVDDAAVIVRSEVPAPAIKDFLASSFVSGKEIKTANAPMAIVAQTPATIPMKEEVRHVLKKPILTSSLVKSCGQYRA